MRLFQSFGLYAAYKARLKRLRAGARSFQEMRQVFLDDRYGAVHWLKPCADESPEAFFTAGDDMDMQRAWAAENGLAPKAGIEDILLAQIEAHRTEILYITDPMRFGNAFLKRVPGCVKRTVTWRAAPSAGGDFADYDILLSSLSSMLDHYRREGMSTHYFWPAHDPAMDAYASNSERPVDVLFVGMYSQHHLRRARILEAVAALNAKYNVALHLYASRMTRLAESPAGLFGPLRKFRRPAAIRAVSKPPTFGRDLYSALGNAKIVINGAIDMAGDERANIRCWEALGCGALMLGEAGRYPEGMSDQVNMVEFNGPEDAVSKVDTLLRNQDARLRMAEAGHEMIATRYSKSAQWDLFQKIVG